MFQAFRLVLAEFVDLVDPCSINSGQLIFGVDRVEKLDKVLILLCVLCILGSGDGEVEGVKGQRWAETGNVGQTVDARVFCWASVSELTASFQPDK